MEALEICRVCLEKKDDISTVFVYKKDKYLPNIIYNISGVNITTKQEPEAQICSACMASVMAAEIIILQCQESEEYLLSLLHKNNIVKARDDSSLENVHMEYEDQSSNISTKGEPQYLEEYDEDVYEDFQIQLVEEQTKRIKKTKNQDVVTEPSIEPKVFEVTNTKQMEISDSFKNEDGTEECCINVQISECRDSTEKTRSEKTVKPVAKVKPKLKEISNLLTKATKKPKVLKHYMHKCEFCAYKTVTRKLFIDHLLLEHEIDDSDIYACTLCARKFSWRRLLYKHIEQDHKQLPAEKKYICDECGKTYTQELHLLQHQRQRHEAESHSCPHPGCNSTFNRVSSLRRHFNNLHTQVKRFYCEPCDKHFSIWDNWS